MLRGLLFDTHLDMPGRRRDPDRDAAARALVQAFNGIMLDVLEAALDAIESGEATSLDHPDLLESARFARAEDQRIRRQIQEMERAGNDALYEAIFR